MVTAEPLPLINPDRAQKMRALGQAVLETEANAVLPLVERLDEGFARAGHLMLRCRGGSVEWPDQSARARAF